MNPSLDPRPEASQRFSLLSVLKARCPACQGSTLLKGWFSLHRRCEKCGHDFYPEPGYFLGAMVISFLLTALLTIPPLVVLKLLDVELWILLVFPFVEFLFLGTFLFYYARILWIHLEYRMTNTLKGR